MKIDAYIYFRNEILECVNKHDLNNLSKYKGRLKSIVNFMRLIYYAKILMATFCENVFI